MKRETWKEDEQAPVTGASDGAGIVVTVKDGEILDYECLCAACYEVFNIGIEEAFGETLPDGTVYLRFWHEVHPGIPGRSAEEHSTGLIINE